MPPPRKVAARSLVGPRPTQQPQGALGTHRVPGTQASSGGQHSVHVSPQLHSSPQFIPSQFPGAAQHPAYANHRMGPGGSQYGTLQYGPHGHEVNPRSSSLSYTASTSNEVDHLRLLLKEELARSQAAARQHALVEEELVSSKAQIDNLTGELQTLKQKKQAADNELAQNTVDYMNSQAKLMEQIDSLNIEVQSIKAKLNKTTDINSVLARENNGLREKVKAMEEAKHKAYNKLSRPDNVQKNSDNLQRMQDELLIKELQSYHKKLKAEIAEVRAVNERLVEDNENFQYLLVEHTVTGDLHPAPIGVTDVSSIPTVATSTLADEEMLELPDTDSPTVKESSGKEPVSQQTSERSSIEDEDSSLSENPTESLQKIINRQKFELRSLENHNKALKLSLERLVDRMLDNKVFSQAVEESVSKPIVSKFRNRVASETQQHLPSLYRAPSNTAILPYHPQSSHTSHSSHHSSISISPLRGVASSTPSRTTLNPPKASPKIWSNMIFNTQYTGNPNRRAFSLGVDDEYKPPTAPSTSKTSHEVGSESTGGHRQRNLSVASTSSIDTFNRVSKDQKKSDDSTRCESITGMKKLRLAP